LQGVTDWEKFDAMTDEQVMAAAIADPDAQPLTDEQLLRFRRPPEVAGGTFIDRIRDLSKENKVSLTVRYDADIAEFYKGRNKNYPRLMNNVLRAYMEEQKASGTFAAEQQEQSDKDTMRKPSALYLKYLLW
jgi:uncharacterized protein (DUF4415 family)